MNLTRALHIGLSYLLEATLDKIALALRRQKQRSSDGESPFPERAC